MRLLDAFFKFASGASLGFISMALADRILCPGIFLDSPLILPGWVILTGLLGTLIVPGACDD